MKLKIILMYHRVADELPDKLHDPHMYVTAQTLNMHLRELKRNFAFVTLEDLISNNAKYPNSCTITFDDGWKDNFEVALPILSEHQAPATIFLSVADIGTNNWFWFEHIFHLANNIQVSRSLQGEFIRFFKDVVPSWDKNEICTKSLLMLNEKLKLLSAECIHNIIEQAYISLKCKKPDFPIVVNWNEVEKMGRFNISFGSHGMNHDILPLLNRVSKIKNIEGSLKILEERNINFTPFFSYPNGNWDNEAIMMLEKSGYRGAVTTQIGNVSSESRFQMKRIGLSEASSKDANLFWYQIAMAVVARGIN